MSTFCQVSFSKSLSWLFQSLIYFLFKWLKDILQISSGHQKENEYNSTREQHTHTYFLILLLHEWTV